MIRILTDLVGAVLLILGAGSAEDLSESEMERFSDLASRPVAINLAPRSRLLACGLFSAYQVASMQDYRQHNGDILGVHELGLVDGFTPDLAEALSHFVSFESASALPRPFADKVHQSLMTQGVVKGSEDFPETYRLGAKYSLQAGQKADFYWSGRTSDIDFGGDFWGRLGSACSPGTFSLALYGKRGWKIVAGDFAARFGQGLVMWSGFSLSGFSSVGAFKRNGTGLAATGSFSPTHRGIGADITKGRYTFSAAVAFPGVREWCDGSSVSGICAMPMLAVSRLGRVSQFGVQGYLKTGPFALNQDENVLGISSAAASLDWKIGLGSFLFYGEAGGSLGRCINAWTTEAGSGSVYYTVSSQWSPAFIAALQWTPAYKTKLVLLCRYFPAEFECDYSGAPRSTSKARDEAAASLGFQFRWLDLTLDAARHPVAATDVAKAVLNLAPSFEIGSKFTLAPSLRLSERCTLDRTTPTPTSSTSQGSSTGVLSKLSTDILSNAKFRTDIRADFRTTYNLTRGTLHCNIRVNLLHYTNTAYLSYLELGFKTPDRFNSSPKISQLPDSLAVSPNPQGPGTDFRGGPEFQVFVRGTIFNVQDWDDRIYCYQRDTPGSFNILAAYGHGYALSAITALKLHPRATVHPTPNPSQARTQPTAKVARRFYHRHAIYLRASLIRYPWSTDRTPRTELKLQYKLDL